MLVRGERGRESLPKALHILKCPQGYSFSKGTCSGLSSYLKITEFLQLKAGLNQASFVIYVRLLRNTTIHTEYIREKAALIFWAPRIRKAVTWLTCKSILMASSFQTGLITTAQVGVVSYCVNISPSRQRQLNLERCIAQAVRQETSEMMTSRKAGRADGIR